MILCVSSLKGGVGKTTIAAFLAQALRSLGRSVLSVDLDHNNNLTDYYLREEDGASAGGIESANVRHVLTGARKIEPLRSIEGPLGTIWSSPLGDIIPATPSLATVGYELASNPASVLRLRSGLRRLEGYDVVIIDTPPALTLELNAGLYAADVVLVPISASRWTIQGYQTIEGEIAKVAEAVGSSPRIIAIPSMVSEQAAAELRAASIDGRAIWQATAASIPRDRSIALAASEGRPLREGTIGERAFRELAEEVAR